MNREDGRRNNDQQRPVIRCIRLVGCVTIAVLAACDSPRVVDPEDDVARHFHAAWTVGGDYDVGTEPLVRPVGAAYGPGGILAVVDADAPRVILLDRSGAFLRSVGGAGGGPGEFNRADAVGIIGDSLWVYDAVGRLTWFDMMGTFLRSEAPEQRSVPGTFWFFRGGQALRGGMMLARVVTRVDLLGDSAVGMPLVLAERGGEIVKVVPQSSPSPLRTSVTMQSGTPLYIEQLYRGEPIFAAVPDRGLVYVIDRTPAQQDTLSYIRIQVYNATGEVRNSVALPYQPVAVTEATHEAARAWFDRINSVNSLWAFEPVYAAYWVPEFLPPVSQALADDDGLWLRREKFAEPAVWERYAPDGTRLYHTLLPSSFDGLAGDANSLLGVQRDSLNVPSLVFYEAGTGT